MPCALIQQVPTPPPVEKLQRAFRAVRFLTPSDAHTLSRDGYGILVKNLSIGDATALQYALHAEGVETEAVEQHLLPELPVTKFVTRLDCRPEVLMIFDPLGRAFPLEWGYIMVIAVGSVRLNEFKRVLQAVTTVTTATSDGESASVTTNEARRREQLSHHLVLEIILTRSVQRFSITADKFNFSYLGERRTKSLPTNFTLLVRDLIQFAPHATLNHGAQLLRDNAAEVWSYPSKNAFTEEIIWMLWQMKKNPAA